MDSSTTEFTCDQNYYIMYSYCTNQTTYHLLVNGISVTTISIDGSSYYHHMSAIFVKKGDILSCKYLGNPAYTKIYPLYS